jgi:hypothetical protein
MLSNPTVKVIVRNAIAKSSPYTLAAGQPQLPALKVKYHTLSSEVQVPNYKFKHKNKNRPGRRFLKPVLEILQTDAKFFTNIFGNLIRRAASVNGEACRLAIKGLPALVQLSRRGLPIGAFREAAYQSAEIGLDAGEILALYTDGVTEARRGEDFFGEDRLMEVIRHAASAEHLPQQIMSSVEKFSGGRLADDLAVLCVTC